MKFIIFSFRKIELIPVHQSDLEEMSEKLYFEFEFSYGNYVDYGTTKTQSYM